MYYLYGCVLTETAIQNNKVLLDTIEDDDDQDEEEGIVADSFEEETPAVASSSTDIPPPVLDQEATQDDQQDENEVDPDDFQIAWEVLEQARLIYEREVKTTPSLANSLANGGFTTLTQYTCN